MPIQSTSAQFTYSSAPHSAPKSKTQNLTPLTLMSDPRVVRGNTHALAKKVSKYKPMGGGGGGARATTSNNGSSSPKPATFNNQQEETTQPTYFYDVIPFASPNVDFSHLLIAQDDHPNNQPKMKNIESQTSEFLPRPATPPYIPRKTGVDKSTQVEDVTELFNFDLEVKPLLEVIVMKTLEQALYEVQSEAELVCLEEAATSFHAVMDEEERWMRQREEEQVKETLKVRSKMASLEEEKRKEIGTKEKIAALQCARQILPPNVDAILDNMFKSEVWKEPACIVAETDIVPSLLSDVEKTLQAFQTAKLLLDDLAIAAEELFHSKPSYENRHRLVPLQVSFSKMAVPEEGEAPVLKQGPVLSFHILPTDSINTIDAKITSEILRILDGAKDDDSASQEVAAEEGEAGEGEESAAVSSSKKAPPLISAEERAALKAMAVQLPSLLPGSAAGWTYRSRLPFDLPKMMSALINELDAPSLGKLDRAIANDALLSPNFPLPSTVVLKVIVELSSE